MGWPKDDLIDENAPDLDLAPETDTYDDYGFSRFTDSGDCGCAASPDEKLDLDALAREVYQLLLREAYVERERLGRSR